MKPKTKNLVEQPCRTTLPHPHPQFLFSTLHLSEHNPFGQEIVGSSHFGQKNLQKQPEPFDKDLVYTPFWQGSVAL